MSAIKQYKTPNEIRRAGLEALARALGPVGMIKFLQQFDSGKGDYSKERHEWLGGSSVDELVEELRQRRSKPARSRRKKSV